MKNKFFKFLALSLAATLLPGTTVCADDSSDYVHVHLHLLRTVQLLIPMVPLSPLNITKKD